MLNMHGILGLRHSMTGKGREGKEEEKDEPTAHFLGSCYPHPSPADCSLGVLFDPPSLILPALSATACVEFLCGSFPSHVLLSSMCPLYLMAWSH